MGRKPKTAAGIGTRIAATMQERETQAAFAASLGISDSTIGNYLRGEREPSYDFLVRLREMRGVNINWLLSGRGAMFEGDRQRTITAAPIQADVMKEIAKIVARVHRDEGVKLSLEAGAMEAARLYNELVAKAEEPDDRTELEALFPWLENRLRKDLRAAQEAPGSGKRSA